MQRLMELVPPVQTFFEHLNNARSVEAILRRMALFQGISAAHLRSIAEQAQIKAYDREERLFAESGPAMPPRESLHILLDGFVKVARRASMGTGRAKSDERIIAYRQNGDYFAGGLDLLGDGGAVTVTAITRTRVIEIPRQVLLSIFQRYPEVSARFSQRIQQYRDAAVAAQTGFFDPLTQTHTETVKV